LSASGRSGYALWANPTYDLLFSKMWAVSRFFRRVGYFHYRNCSQTLSRIRNHLEQRLIIHLRKRHKVRDRISGYVRFPNRSLYEKYNLYKVPTTAGWVRVHALQ